MRIIKFVPILNTPLIENCLVIPHSLSTCFAAKKCEK